VCLTDKISLAFQLSVDLKKIPVEPAHIVGLVKVDKKPVSIVFKGTDCIDVIRTHQGRGTPVDGCQIDGIFYKFQQFRVEKFQGVPEFGFNRIGDFGSTFFFGQISIFSLKIDDPPDPGRGFDIFADFACFQ
jgi:hypothetical protein